MKVNEELCQNRTSTIDNFLKQTDSCVRVYDIFYYALVKKKEQNKEIRID